MLLLPIEKRSKFVKLAYRVVGSSLAAKIQGKKIIRQKMIRRHRINKVWTALVGSWTSWSRKESILISPLSKFRRTRNPRTLWYWIHLFRMTNKLETSQSRLLGLWTSPDISHLRMLKVCRILRSIHKHNLRPFLCKKRQPSCQWCMRPNTCNLPVF